MHCKSQFQLLIACVVVVGSLSWKEKKEMLRSTCFHIAIHMGDRVVYATANLDMT